MDLGWLLSFFSECGGLHLPVSAFDRGPYKRVTRLNGPLGAGSQLASISPLGFSWSGEPSELYWNVIH